MIAVLILALAVNEVGDPCRAVLEADVNRDHVVNSLDLIDVMLCLGELGCDEADVNRDGAVDADDLAALLEQFGQDDNVCNWIDICTVQDLDAIRDNLNGNYRLACDLDMELADPAGWTPIGTQLYPFAGVLYGSGAPIINFSVQQTETAGLFAWVAGAWIRDVFMIGADVTGGDFAGILAGYAVGGSRIEGCGVEGSIVGRSYVGGLLGEVRSSSILDCRAQVNVVSQGGQEYWTGGLVGHCYGSTVVRGSWSTGTVSSVWRDAGGLIGQLNGGTVERCWSDASVVHARGGSGGLIGVILGGAEVFDSYAWGSVVADEDSPSIWCGGLIGAAFSSTVRRCYAAGVVNEGVTQEGFGGLIGRNFSSLVDDHWDAQASGLYLGCGGGDCHGAEGHSTAEMGDPSTFAGWDFDQVWTIEDSYPQLQIGVPGIAPE